MNAKERFEQAKREITEDIKEGVLPENIKCFEDLDLYVDANYYGGFIDGENTIELIDEKAFDLVNKVQDDINEWLKTGRKNG